MTEPNGTQASLASLENRINQTLVSEIRLIGTAIDALKGSLQEFRLVQEGKNANFGDREQQHTLGNKLQEVTLRVAINSGTVEEVKGKLESLHDQLADMRRKIETDEAREEFDKQEVKNARVRKVDRKESLLRSSLASLIIGVFISLPLGLINLLILHTLLK